MYIFQVCKDKARCIDGIFFARDYNIPQSTYSSQSNIHAKKKLDTKYFE